MVDHFATQAQALIAGKAKAMIVTRSRLHAVRYKLAIDRYIAETRAALAEQFYREGVRLFRSNLSQSIQATSLARGTRCR